VQLRDGMCRNGKLDIGGIGEPGEDTGIDQMGHQS
jgi:hypothetical protein